ncbi:MAG: HAMP domain-containing sensor histidine kinase [Nocardioides sp.]|uniref:sensor histidine kinase n=1 Tax=Nocardioides sp. TaxID=35761 RepID=UPI0039E5A117
MRRSMILTVAAVVSMLLLAMLVPTAILLRDYALADRVSHAALGVQATETVVSGQDKGAVATYLERVNRDSHVQTTVLYPPSAAHPEGDAIGPTPGEDDDVARARRTGRASIEASGGGAELLVPVSLGGSSAAPADTPVVRVRVSQPGFESEMARSWLVLAALGVVLFAGALVLADRLGRSFVLPIRRLAEYAGALGGRSAPAPVAPAGPAEVRELTVVMNRLVGRVETMLERERNGLADLSHRLRTPMTALRLRIEGIGDSEERERLNADLGQLQETVDRIVRQARYAGQGGVAPECDGVSVLAERARFWRPLAEDQGRDLAIEVTAAAPRPVAVPEETVQAVMDALLDNVFTHTPEGTAVAVSIAGLPGGGLELTVDDGGPGFATGLDPVGRGSSGGGSTGLGLAIVQQAATESGGGLRWESSPSGGGRVVVRFGPRSDEGLSG